MTSFLLNLLLALAWAALSGSFEPLNLLFGFALGFLALALSQRGNASPTRSYARRARLGLELAGVFLLDMFTANLRMAATVLSPRLHQRLRPAVIAVPLELRSLSGITLLSNLITLTPGTLSLDVSGDRRTLFVHVLRLDDPEEFRREIKTRYERRIMELTEA